MSEQVAYEPYVQSAANPCQGLPIILWWALLRATQGTATATFSIEATGDLIFTSAPYQLPMTGSGPNGSVMEYIPPPANPAIASELYGGTGNTDLLMTISYDNGFGNLTNYKTGVTVTILPLLPVFSIPSSLLVDQALNVNWGVNTNPNIYNVPPEFPEPSYGLMQIEGTIGRFQPDGSVSECITLPATSLFAGGGINQNTANLFPIPERARSCTPSQPSLPLCKYHLLSQQADLSRNFRTTLRSKYKARVFLPAISHGQARRRLSTTIPAFPVYRATSTGRPTTLSADKFRITTRPHQEQELLH